MKKLLWLDDIRDPYENDWLNFSPIGKDVEVHWVKSHFDFIDWILDNGLPDGVCFDHDLGEGITVGDGYLCAKFLCHYCLVEHLPTPPYNIHSANPVGKENIKCFIENFNSFRPDMNEL